MYKSFADLESGLDFFQTVSKNRHSRNLPFCFLQTGKTLLFIMPQIRNRPHKMTQRSKR